MDYSQTYVQCFQNPKKLVEFGIDEEEVGAIEEAAFNIIRLRTIPDMPKVHKIMRDLPKYCRTPEGKKDILKIAEEVEPLLKPAECVNSAGRPLTLEELDAKWASKNNQKIIYRVKKNANRHEIEREKETPLELLDAAYKKMMHPDMDLSALGTADFKKGREVANAIQERAAEIEAEIFRLEKELKRLGSKKK